MVYMTNVSAEISLVSECNLHHNSSDNNKEVGSNPVMISGIIYEFTIFRNFVNFHPGKSSTSKFPISQISQKESNFPECVQ